MVLTLVTGNSEGHLAYRSQSDNPLQGTTLGGATDDPRREGTRTAPACHPTCSSARQCQSGLPGGRDLPRAVLSLAAAGGALWPRRHTSPSAASPSRPTGGTGPRNGAAAVERGGECRDVGRRPDCHLRGPALGPARGLQYGATGPAAGRPGHAAATADRPRASRPADRWAVD